MLLFCETDGLNGCSFRLPPLTLALAVTDSAPFSVRWVLGDSSGDVSRSLPLPPRPPDAAVLVVDVWLGGFCVEMMIIIDEFIWSVGRVLPVIIFWWGFCTMVDSARRGIALSLHSGRD